MLEGLLTVMVRGRQCLMRSQLSHPGIGWQLHLSSLPPPAYCAARCADHLPPRAYAPPARQICHGAPQDSRADQELPLLTQHDVHCMKTLGQVGAAVLRRAVPCCAPLRRHAWRVPVPQAGSWLAGQIQRLLEQLRTTSFISSLLYTSFKQEFEIDFISLSYCNSADDVLECRGLLASLGMTQTKIIAKASVINIAAAFAAAA